MDVEITPKYNEKVFVSGVDEDGIKELFDDFCGEFICIDKEGRWVVSDGASIHHIHASRVKTVV